VKKKISVKNSRNSLVSKKPKLSDSQPYTYFAQYYDEIMGDHYEKLWWKSFVRLSREKRLKYKKIVDLAGGTGSAAKRLYTSGTKIWIVDQSQAMLKQAKKKLPAAKCLVQDIRKVHLPEKVDLAVCVYGGIHYLKSLTEIRQFFKAVRTVLKPGGVFCFDQYSVQYLKQLCAEKQLEFSGEKYQCLWNLRWDAKKRCAEIHMQGFEGRPGAWQSTWTEKHFHYSFSQKEIKKELKNAGFDQIVAEIDQKVSKASRNSDFKLIFAQ
jgi:ubiquinone/menaquinone biosynthesis C-methylase UbiE